MTPATEMQAILSALNESREQLEVEADVLASRGLKVLQELSNRYGPQSAQVKRLKDYVNSITQVVNIDGDKYSDPQIQAYIASKTDELADLEAEYFGGKAPAGGKQPVQAGMGGGMMLLVLGVIGGAIWFGTRKR